MTPPKKPSVEPYADRPRMGRVGRAPAEVSDEVREIARRCMADPGQAYRHTGPPTIWDDRTDPETDAGATGSGREIGPRVGTERAAQAVRKRLQRELTKLEPYGWKVSTGKFRVSHPAAWGLWVTYTPPTRDAA